MNIFWRCHSGDQKLRCFQFFFKYHIFVDCRKLYPTKAYEPNVFCLVSSVNTCQNIIFGFSKLILSLSELEENAVQPWFPLFIFRAWFLYWIWLFRLILTIIRQQGSKATLSPPSSYVELINYFVQLFSHRFLCVSPTKCLPFTTSVKFPNPILWTDRRPRKVSFLQSSIQINSFIL